jgi:hypothetical protein
MLAGMRHSTFHQRKFSEIPAAWREVEYPALPADAADIFDDRVSEEVFDAEGELEEVGNIVHAMRYDAN